MMKTKIVFPLVMVILFAACTPAGDNGRDGSSTATIEPILATLTETPADPTPTVDFEATYGMTYIREEEKLARDVYQVLFDTWGSRVFNNIVSSEQQHMDAVGTLLSTYFLPDPAADTLPGQFSNPTLQALYDESAAQGILSLSDALKVAAGIEEMDILDLKHFLEMDLPGDVRLSYENLLTGSYNHLSAFVTIFERQADGVYTPQYLTPEAYQEILALTSTTGHGDGSGGYRGTPTP
jgi:hypothetical protein